MQWAGQARGHMGRFCQLLPLIGLTY